MSSRYRLYPTPAQEVLLNEHCGHARYVWNLAVEQLNYRHHRQAFFPTWVDRSRQLTEARREFEWLAAGSCDVQRCALRDFDQALKGWWAKTHRRPKWRKLGRNDGFGVTGSHEARVEKLNKKWSAIHVPKIGLVKFRRTRNFAPVSSFRVTRDSTGRWFVALVSRPDLICGPGDQSVVGVDRGVAVTLALSDGATYQAPVPIATRRRAQAVARCKRGSNRRKVAKARLARIQSRNKDRRKDFVEKASTQIARNYDLIRIEDLRVLNM